MMFQANGHFLGGARAVQAKQTQPHCLDSRPQCPWARGRLCVRGRSCAAPLSQHKPLCERLATPRHCPAVAPKFGRSAVQHFLRPSHLATISGNLVCICMYVLPLRDGCGTCLHCGAFTDCPMGIVCAGGDAEPCWDREPCHECRVRLLRTHVSGSCPNSKEGRSNPNVQHHR